MTSRPAAALVSARELARAAAVPLSRVEALVASGELLTVGAGFIRWADAIDAGRRLRDGGAGLDGQTSAPAWPVRSAPRLALLVPDGSTPRAAAMPAAVSGLAHAAVLLTVVALTSVGLETSPVAVEPSPREELRLVYLVQPGPGGGGGGGGLRQRLRPPKAERAGDQRLSSPVPPPQEPAPVQPSAEPPPPPDPKPQAEIVAPVASVPADDRDRDGLPQETPASEPSHGPGEGGGTGSGSGTGLGEGTGPGIGPGSGGGTGGGPYRPGSGIEPPRLLHEVKPDYPEEARRQGVAGEVELEIVVRRDGSVGDIRLLRGLGHGLDAKAIDAVRRWRFAPARRLGAPVDVIVEVAVEFRLR